MNLQREKSFERLNEQNPLLLSHRYESIRQREQDTQKKPSEDAR